MSSHYSTLLTTKVMSPAVCLVRWQIMIGFIYMRAVFGELRCRLTPLAILSLSVDSRILM